MAFMTGRLAWLTVVVVLSICTPGSAMAAHPAVGNGDTKNAAPVGAHQATTNREQNGRATFEEIKALAGEWEAPLDEGGRMVNIFTPFAYGTKVVASEWENGKYITSTIFYMVGTELRADHFCDFKNEPRYLVKASAADPNMLQFEFRYATNLDTHPVHFHSTTWHIVGKDHLTQDWYIRGGKKAMPPDHMEFTRTKLSLRPDGSPIPPASGGGS